MNEWLKNSREFLFLLVIYLLLNLGSTSLIKNSIKVKLDTNICRQMHNTFEILFYVFETEIINTNT